VPTTWEPADLYRTVWGVPQLVIGGVDSTFFRGAPVGIEEWSSGDPFDDAAAMLSLPQVTVYDKLGEGELVHIYDGAPVEINLVRPDESVKVLWEGFIVSYSYSNGTLQLQCLGELYQIDFYVKQPRFYIEKKKYEDLIRWGFAAGLLVEFPTWWDVQDDALNNVTGHETRYSGSWQKILTGYIQELLSMMVTYDGRQWTLMKNVGRQPVLRLKTVTPISAQWTIAVGQRGVAESLTRDLTQSVTMVYGQGTDQSGGIWRNAYFKEANLATYYDPLYQSSSQLERWEKGPGFRVESFHDFGAGASLKEAKIDAKKIVARDFDPGWYGTIVLTADPAEGSRFEIKAGEQIRLKYFAGTSSPPSQTVYSTLLEEGVYSQRDSTGDFTRGQMSTVIVNMMTYMGITLPAVGADTYSDVAGTAHEENILRLTNAGIIEGFTDGTFRPNEGVTRAQTATMVVKTVEWDSGTLSGPTSSYYTDITGNVHEDNINKAYEHDLMYGYGGEIFRPDQTLTRLQSATVLWRLNDSLGGTLLAEEADSTIFHIAEAIANTKDGTVTLRVDTKSRDLLTLSEIEERNRDSRTPLRLMQVDRRSHTVEDRYQPWDTTAGSGIVPPAAVEMGEKPEDVADVDWTWTGKSFVQVRSFNDELVTLTQAFPPSTHPEFYLFINGSNAEKVNRWAKVIIPMAERINVRMSQLIIVNSAGSIVPAKFHTSVYYDTQVEPYDMPRDANGDPDPFTADAFDSSLPDPDGDRLRPHESLIVGWGDDDQAAGYWPGLESRGDPATGIFKDEGTWQHTMPRHYFEVAVMAYAEVDCYLIGRFFPGIEW